MTIRIADTVQELREDAALLSDWSSLKARRVPLLYRLRVTNWLIARPWRWAMRDLYRAARRPAVDMFGWPVHGTRQTRLRAAVTALATPHAHHRNET